MCRINFSQPNLNVDSLLTSMSLKVWMTHVQNTSRQTVGILIESQYITEEQGKTILFHLEKSIAMGDISVNTSTFSEDVKHFVDEILGE